MALIDRYPKRALGMAIFQIAVWLLLVIYAFTTPSLGSKALLPGLAITAAFAALVWMTLHRPWDWQFGVEGGAAGGLRYRIVWAPGLLIGCTLGLTYFHETLLSWGKRRVVAYADDAPLLTRIWVSMEEREAWDADTYGMLLLANTNGVLPVLFPLLVLGLVWVFLPR